MSRLAEAPGSAEPKGKAAEGACAVPAVMQPGVQENILGTVAKRRAVMVASEGSVYPAVP